MEEQLVDLAEMARILNVHEETVRRYVRNERIRYYKLPAEDDERGHLRFRPSEVLADLRKEPK